MNRRECLAALACLPLAGLTGGAMAAGTSAERSRSIGATYAASFDQVWEAVPAALRALALPVSADNRGEGYVLSESGASALNWRERIAIFIEGAPRDCTRVVVIYKRAPGTDAAATDPVAKIIANLDGRFARA